MKNTNINPELEYVLGNTVVPAKALEYKFNSAGEVVEKITPRTVEFERKLNQELKELLHDVPSFPTAKEVLISITHGLHAVDGYKRCDLDNRAKTIMDALKGVIYADDNQVKVLWSDKLLVEKAQESYCRIAVKLLDNTALKKVQARMQMS